MTDALQDDILAVIREFIPDSDQIDNKTMKVLVGGQQVEYDKDEFSASYDLTELFKLVHEWAPIIANLFTVAKILYDFGKGEKKAAPTADEIVDSYVEKYGQFESRDKLRQAAELVAGRMSEKDGG
ncbi:hypothetical protein JQ617_27440 [Bradyrhizobium sp. KB893862 SZCCT0404]|uniref:hypothetical protein n=1 Tax=Bradyrhizobium sp. KB893862 SZCCT0404 TaxID=2807672 RepID=UPI001BA8B936|nr:hypothetical protein [Bradyrhizobium sp. KB893862 SZCCT0404]MBR1177721.1 hypothetical protein [Bradyrhizobium sp. KB893862 SZCCT0404]